jgi:predicted ATPase
VDIKRYILTGTPSAGKTALLQELAARGHAVVPEAATDVIARAHASGIDESGPGLIDDIVETQRARQEAPVPLDVTVQFFDRSPICTLALVRYAGRPVSRVLAAEVDRVLRADLYERSAFLVRPIGFVTRTAVRRITYEQSLRFERIHEEVYHECGFELVEIPPATVRERAAMVMSYLGARLAR